MTKAKKPSKNEGSKSVNSVGVVQHQKLCLSIDMVNRRIYGYTELKIAVPGNGIVGLHADNLEIERICLDGEPTEFDVFPHYLPVEIENRWCSVSSVSSAADAAGATYLSALERELVPNLLILCRKPMDPVQDQQGQPHLENGGQANGDVKQNVRLVRIDYSVEKADTGIHFDDNVLHTDNQIRRAHCWFPCIDDCSQSCCYDLEFTVPENFVAVSNGSLLYQVLSEEDPPRKTYVYKLNVPVSAQWISLVVAPFQILADNHSSLLSHMCLPPNLPKLQNTVGFFHSAFRYYESYLKTPFPFGSYKQVFIAPGMTVSGVNLGASMTIFSSQMLFDERVIDQIIDTRIKLAHALARQWFGVYITPETPNDEWLVEGLAGFLTDTFIKEFLGNNEACYRRYKANSAVCKADDIGATALSSSASTKDLYGTQSIGFYGRIRSWKSVAVLHMLEKQMGPELFKGILRTIITRAQNTVHSSRMLGTKEFRHFCNKFGNLERPFLKEFFHRWVGTCGCPVLRLGFSYNKRKNMVELAALRECTASQSSLVSAPNGNLDSEIRDGDGGWPGMMTIKIHELDGTHDHLLPMAGDTWQLVEIKCHSKLAAKRFHKPKKGTKPDGSDDNGDAVSALDMRPGVESPLLWLRADPELEYLAEIHFNQPVQMWINQLEKDKDVVAQAQAISILESLPYFPYCVINALGSFLGDSKAFWRVRVEAAFALAKTASEDTDWAGMVHLVKFYKNKRFDANIGLPKPNDFHDFAEYLLLEAIPHAVATVRAADKKSPREAVEFVLQVLKYNDNSGNPYSDVFWLAAIVEAVGELEFGQETVLFLSSLLKQIDRLLQFERLMPSHNGILTVSCIRTLTQIALKFSDVVPCEHVYELIKPFRSFKVIWQVRIEASRALLDLEFHSNDIDAALLLFIEYLEEEPSLRGQVKLGVHMSRLCQIIAGSVSGYVVKSQNLVALLRLLESRVAFNNVCLRHHLYCILQVLAGRCPTLYGIPRDQTRQVGYAEICNEQRNNFAALINQVKPSEFPHQTQSLSHDCLLVSSQTTPPEFPIETPNLSHVGLPIPDQINPSEIPFETRSLSHDGLPSADRNKSPEVPLESHRVSHEGSLAPGRIKASEVLETHSLSLDGLPAAGQINTQDIPPGTLNLSADRFPLHQIKPLEFPLETHSPTQNAFPLCKEILVEAPHGPNSISHDMPVAEALREDDTISQDRKLPVVKFRVKHSVASTRAETADNLATEKSQRLHNENDRAASSYVSGDGPARNHRDSVSMSNQNIERVNSCQGRGSQMSASIVSAIVAREGEEIRKDLQCTAESSCVQVLPQLDDQSSPNTITDDVVEAGVQKSASLQTLSVGRKDSALGIVNPKQKGKKKEKEKKRKRDDHKSHREEPGYLERKRLKKERKQKKKEMTKLLNDGDTVSTALPKEPTLMGNGKDVSVEVPGKEDETSMMVEAERIGAVDLREKNEVPTGTAERNRLLDVSEKNEESRELVVNPGVVAAEPKIAAEAKSESKPEESGHGRKIRIKIKKRMLDKS